MAKLISFLIAFAVGSVVYVLSFPLGDNPALIAGGGLGYGMYRLVFRGIALFSYKEAVARLLDVPENEISATTRNTIKNLEYDGQRFEVQTGRFEVRSLFSPRNSPARVQLLFRCTSTQVAPPAVLVFELGEILIGGAPKWYRQSSDTDGCFFDEKVDLKYSGRQGIGANLITENGVLTASSIAILLEDAELKEVHT